MRMITQKFCRRGNGRNGRTRSSNAHTLASTYATEMLPSLPSGATKEIMITDAYGAYNIKKVCKKLTDFVKQAGTYGSVQAAYKLRHGKTKTHLALVYDPDRNPYPTKNIFNDASGNDMSKSEKKVAPI